MSAAAGAAQENYTRIYPDIAMGAFTLLESHREETFLSPIAP